MSNSSVWNNRDVGFVLAKVDISEKCMKELDFNHLWQQKKCDPRHRQKKINFKKVIFGKKHIKHIKHVYTTPNYLGTTHLHGLILKNWVGIPGDPPEIFNMCRKHGAETLRMHNNSTISVERTVPIPHLLTKLYAQSFFPKNHKIIVKQSAENPCFKAKGVLLENIIPVRILP